jgi:hypothetical protein
MTRPACLACSPATIFILTCLLLPAGCGSPAAQAPASAADAEAGSAAALPGDAAAADDAAGAPPGPAPLSSTLTAPPAAPPLTVPKATVEQILSWTPSPFEPLHLLSIQEWSTTSFTSRLASAGDGRHYLVAGSRVLLWSIDGDAPAHQFLDVARDGADRDLTALAASPDGKWFAVGDSDGVLRVWSLADRSELATKKIYATGIQAIAISPDAEEIATIAYDGKVSTWSAPALDQRREFEVDARGVERIEYAAPSQLAAAGATTSIWNTATGARIAQLSPGRYNFALARTPDGSKLLFGGEDELRTWDVAKSKTLTRAIHGPAGNEWLAVSPDGAVVAATNGRQILLWSLGDGRLVQAIDGYGSAIVGLAWLPTTNLLAVASESGVTRLWGTADQGAAVGLKPLQAPIPPPPPGSHDPATPELLAQVLDLRSFPALSDCAPNVASPGNYSCEAHVAAAEAQAFYGYFFDRAGWSIAMDPNNPAALSFRKGSFAAAAYCYGSGDAATSVSVHHAGNYDVRWTSRFDAAPTESVYEDANVVTYRTKAPLVDIEVGLLRKFHDAGWAAYSRLNTSHSEEPDQRDIEFLKNGATLRVAIGKFPADPASYTIRCSLFANNAWAPVPPDAGFVEFDGSTEPVLIAITGLNLDDAEKFYDGELAAQTWLKRSSRTSSSGDDRWLSYAFGQRDLRIHLQRQPDGRTLVRTGEASSGSLWEASLPKDEVDEEQPPATGLEAADFPLLNATKTGKFDSIGHTIEVAIDGATLANVAEIYTKALGDLGWQAADGGIRDEEYTFFDFTKDGQEISLRARKQDGNAIVSFEGDGLLWTKELPGGKQVVSYETWLRLNKLPPSLEFLDRYATEMRSIAGP